MITNSKKTIQIIFFIIAYTLLLYILFHRLGYEYTHVDEFLWLTRSENFFNGIKNRNFSETYQQYHPGVTLMYLIGTGQQLYNQKFGVGSWEKVGYEKWGEYNKYIKLPIVVVITTIILAIAIFTAKKHNYTTAIVFLALVATEPFLIANLRNAHMDGLLSTFTFAAVIFTLDAFEQKTKKSIFLASFFTGLSILTKSPALILMPIMGLCWLVKTIRSYKILLLILFGSVITTYIFFPALWAAPVKTIENIVNTGIRDVGIKTGHNHYIDNKIIRDPGEEYYINIIKFRFTPEIVIGSGLILIGLFLSIKTKNSNITKNYFILIFFVVAYFGAFTYATKKNERYITPVILPIMYMISMSAGLTSTKINHKLLLVLGVGGVLLFYSRFASIKKLNTNFFTYYSPLFGGIEKASKVIYLNQGGSLIPTIANKLNNLNLPPETLIGITDHTNLAVLSKYKVSGLQYSKLGKYDIVIIPIQRGYEYKKGMIKYDTEKVGNMDYWTIYVSKSLAEKLNK